MHHPPATVIPDNGLTYRRKAARVVDMPTTHPPTTIGATMPRTQETVREATDREKFRNGFGPTGETRCAVCHEESPTLYVYGVMTPNGMAWSVAYCGQDCHTFAVEEGI